MQLIEKIMACYGEQQVVSFATSDGVQPRVRPMSLIYFNGRFYMVTGARGGKDARKLKQLRANPRFEYYLTLKGKEVDGFIRGMGKAEELRNINVKRQVYEKIAWAANYFSSPDHPDFVLLELQHDGFSYRSPDESEIQYVEI